MTGPAPVVLVGRHVRLEPLAPAHAPKVQRSAVNTEAKLLMLTHAFQTWRVRRVSLKTDARNAGSRAAIERLGARFDGVLRAHMPAADEGLGDSAFYSVLDTEWPAVPARLTARLTATGVTGS